MTIEFRCPNCQKKLKTADDRAGRTARCPQCGTGITVPAEANLDEAFDASAESDGGDFGGFDAGGASGLPPRTRPPRPADRSTELACPMCGAANAVGASRCYACGEDLIATAPSGGGALRFNDIFAAAWDRWSANLGTNCGAAFLAALAIVVGISILFGVPVFLAVAVAAGLQAEPVGIIFAILIGMLGYVAAVAWVFYLQLGMTGFSLRQARDGRAEIGDLFAPLRKVPAVVVLMLLVVIVTSILTIPGVLLQTGGQVIVENDNLAGLALLLVGYVLQIAGQVAGLALFWPVPYMIADRTTGLFAALPDGVRLAIGNYKLSLLLAGTHLGLVIAGTATCLVGLLFAYPLSFVLFAVAYDRFRRAYELRPI